MNEITNVFFNQRQASRTPETHKNSNASRISPNKTRIFTETKNEENHNPTIDRLKLSEDVIRQVTRCENLGDIQDLDLTGNSKLLKYRIRYISGLQNVLNLRELNLSNNDIEKIDGLSSLKRLRVLNLSGNKITKIEGISGLKSLEILNLSENLIEGIPQTISLLQSLTTLNLSSNNVSKKDDIIHLKPLAKLGILNLSNNPVSELPEYYNHIMLQLKRLIYLDGQVVQKNPNKRLSSVEQKSSPRYTTTSQTMGDMRSPERGNESFSDSYEKRLNSTQTKLNKIALMNSQLVMQGFDKNGSMRFYDDGSVTEFANGSSTGGSGSLGNETMRRHSSQPKTRIPGLKINQEGMLNDNTLYSYSESMLDTKSKNTPLVSNRNKQARYCDKENQEIDFSQLNQMDLSNNGIASQLNLSSIEQTSPHETSRADKSFNQREREHIISKLKEIFHNIYQEHTKIDQKAQQFNQIYEEIRSKKTTINGLVQSLSQVLNIIQDANVESDSRAEREEVLKRRHDLISKIKELLAFEEDLTRTQISYYTLQTKIKGIQLTNRTEEMSLLLKDLERECETLKEKIQAYLYSLDLISLDIIKIEATIKTKLRSIPDLDQNDEFQPENQAINTHFKQLSTKVHELEKDIQTKLQVFDSIRESFLTVLRGVKTILNLKVNEQIDLNLIQNIQKELEPKIKIITPLGDPNASHETSLTSGGYSSSRKTGPAFKYFQGTRTLGNTSIEKDRDNSVGRDLKDTKKNPLAYVAKQLPFYMNTSAHSKSSKTLSKGPESQESFVFQGSTEQEGTQSTGRGNSSGRGNMTLRGDKEKMEFYKNFQNPWEGIAREETECISCKKKDKIVSAMQEELISAQRKVFEAQEEITKLTKLISDQKQTHENQIVSMQGILEASTKLIQEEKLNYERNLNNFAEVCDRNTFKITEIHSKLDIILKKPDVNYSSQKWIIEAQASAFEGLILHNQELNNTLKTLIIDYKVLSQGHHGPQSDRERSLTLAPASNKTSDHVETPHNLSNPEQEESLNNFYTQHSNTEKLVNISNINMSKPSQFESCPNVLEIPQSEPKSEHSRVPEFEEIKPELLGTFASQYGCSLPLTATNRSIETYPSHRVTEGPNSSTSKNLDEKTLGNSKANRELLERIKEFTVNKKVYPQSGQNTGENTSAFISDISVKHDEHTSQLHTSALNHLSAFPKMINHSKSNSLSSLQKILFGSQVTDDTILEKTGDYISPRALNRTEILKQDPESTKPRREYFDPVKRFNIFKQRSLTPDDYSADNQISNLQESIALHLVENSNKKDSERVLKKVSSNIQNYKLMTKKDKSLDKSTQQAGKQSTDSSRINYFVSPVKFTNMTSPGQENEKSPMSVRNTLNTTTKQTNISMASSTKGSYHLDYKQVYRKPAEYQSNSHRGMSANYVNFINQKRKLLESPDVAHYSEKFDFSSPYHPMYAHSMIEGHTQMRNNVSNFSAMSNSRNSYGGRQSFISQVQSDHNKILSDH